MSVDTDKMSINTIQIGERYELLKQLGSGSFSEVCLATDRSTGDKVRGSVCQMRTFLSYSIHTYTTASMSCTAVEPQVSPNSKHMLFAR